MDPIIEDSFDRTAPNGRSRSQAKNGRLGLPRPRATVPRSRSDGASRRNEEFPDAETNEGPTNNILESSALGLHMATMIYIFADLRLLSATGYASTPFEQLMVDSDAYYGRLTAPLGIENKSVKRRTAGNMLLALLQELQREAASFCDCEALEAQREALQSIGGANVANHQSRVRRESSFAAQHRRQNAAPMVFLPSNRNDSFFSPRNSSMLGSRKSMIGTVTSEDEKDERAQTNNVLLDCVELVLQSSLKDDSESRPTTCKESQQTLNGDCLNRTFKLKHSQMLLHNLYRDAMAAGLVRQASNRHLGNQTHNQVDVDEKALYLLEEACKAPSSDPIYKVLTQQFKPNSIGHKLLSGGTELVWFHDYFPSHELVFGITVNKAKKVIQVVFRGTAVIDNWFSNLDLFGMETANPILEKYPGKEEFFKLHKGFQMYTLRERRDTHQPWWRTICDLVDHFGQLNFGDDYRLILCGHSLGGAAATIVGFYASTDPRMTANGPILIESFASPMVGCHYFADAFRHQERVGKVRHARFYNQDDIVPRMPFNVKLWEKRGSPWAHTGIGVELRNTREDAWSIRAMAMSLYYSLTPRADEDRSLVKIEYSRAKSYWWSVIDALKCNVFLHLDFHNPARHHAIEEHGARLEKALGAEGTIECLSQLNLEDLYRQHFHLEMMREYEGSFDQKVVISLCHEIQTPDDAIARHFLQGTN